MFKKIQNLIKQGNTFELTKEQEILFEKLNNVQAFSEKDILNAIGKSVSEDKAAICYVPLWATRTSHNREFKALRYV